MFKKTIEKLEEELKELWHQLKVVIPRDLQRAAAHGDLSENAEYDEARERKRFTESRVSQLTGRIRDLKGIDIDKIPADRVGLGSIVTLEDLGTGNEITYELALADDVDVDSGKISLKAPIGRALMGRNIDDEVSVALPAGKKEYLIINLKTLHQRDSL
ncbi:MAG: transcription elongation factor GreA [bacterium]|nr:MAG: transcription elongation factor GreA [bacterium]